MLKKYPVDMLQEGMIVGRTVYAEDMSVLLGEKTVLDRQRIEYLKQRGVLFVRVVEPDAPEAPSEEQASPPAAPDAQALWRSVQDSAAAAVAAAAEAAKKEVAAKAKETPQQAVAPDDGDLPAARSAEAVAAEPMHESPSASGIVPRKTSALEAAYIEQYEACFTTLRAFYDAVRARGRIDAAQAQTLAQSMMALCSSAKAVTHIYNMETLGEYQLHHTMRVAILAGLMGQWLKMPVQDRQRLVLAGILIDIGYTCFAPNFLKKIARYTPEERRLMQKHSRLGFDLVSRSVLQLDKQVVESVLQHHERNDGSGYPQKMKRDGICKFARILAILDTYDAMASRRFYAKRRSPFEVFAVLADEFVAGRLDTEYGVVFIRNISHTLNGNWVKLSNGTVGKIVYLDESRINALPIVQTTDGDFLDLNTMASIKVEYLLPSAEVEKKE